MQVLKRVPSTVLYAKKAAVQDHLDNTLRAAFKDAALRAELSIYRNEDLAPTYAVGVTDMNRPDDFVGRDVLDFVRARVEEIVPDSRPFVAAMRVVKPGL
jgi:hypothetical protein